MSVPCWYFDSKTLIIKGANAEATKLFGYSAQEFVGLNSIKLLSKLDGPRMLAVRRAEKWGQAGSFTFARKDGTLFTADIRWHQGDYHGTLCDCIIIVPMEIVPIEVNENTTAESDCECPPAP